MEGGRGGMCWGCGVMTSKVPVPDVTSILGIWQGAVGISVTMDRDLKILWGSISNLAKPFHLSHRDDKHTSPQIPLQSDIS